MLTRSTVTLTLFGLSHPEDVSIIVAQYCEPGSKKVVGSSGVVPSTVSYQSTPIPVGSKSATVGPLGR